jgi:putative hydrolase of the HAD superfamily
LQKTKEHKLSIKAVVFDYGNVISLPQDPKTMDVLAGRVGVEREKFESTLWSLRSEYDRGTISSKEYYKIVLASLAVSMDEKSIEELIEIDINSWKNINTETVALMEDLKRAGYLVGILSNMPHDFLSWAKENLPVFSLPHVGLYSCDVNLVKPEEAIYRKLLSMLAVEAGELVFFDDKVENIKGAAAVGIEAILWKNPKEARRELISLGLKL